MCPLSIILTYQFSVINTQEPLSQNVFLSPSKSKQAKKKDKNSILKSPCKKDGDIRTLFSTATKSTKNYTKHINDLGINDGKIPIRLFNLLVDLSLENKNVAKYCYMCLNICNCTIIKDLRENESCAFSYTQPVSGEPYLPNINLIDELNKDSFIKYSENFPDDKVDSKKEDLNVDEKQKIENEKDVKPINELNNNFDMEIDFESLCELDSPILEKETEVNENNKEKTDFDIGDTSDIFRLSADTSPEKVIETEDNNENSKSIDALDYFHLSSIDDIFADTDDKVQESESENEVQPLNTANIVDSIIIESDEDMSDNETKKHNVLICPTSPSILSGGVKKNYGGSTSPILCSQKQKTNIAKTNEQQFKSSTPKISATECIDVRYQAQNKLLLSENKKVHETPYNKRDLQNLNDKSMFTITQLVDMINKSESDKTLGSPANGGNMNKNRSKSESIHIRRAPSPVILTQRDKKNKMNTNETDRQKVTQLPTESVVILDSDSEDSTKEYDFENIINNEYKTMFHDETKSINITEYKNKNISESKFVNHTLVTSQLPAIKSNFTQFDTLNNTKAIKSENNKQNNTLSMPNKRKFAEDSLASPYFSKKPKLNGEPKKTLTLQKKVLAALSYEFKDESFSNNQHVNFMVSSTRLSPILMSQKENYDESSNKSPKSSSELKLHSNLDKLQMYRRDNKCSPKNNILKDSTNTSLLQRKKISFSDSDDDDFITSKKGQSKTKLEVNGVHDNSHIKRNVSFFFNGHFKISLFSVLHSNILLSFFRKRIKPASFLI